MYLSIYLHVMMSIRGHCQYLGYCVIAQNGLSRKKVLTKQTLGSELSQTIVDHSMAALLAL